MGICLIFMLFQKPTRILTFYSWSFKIKISKKTTAFDAGFLLAIVGY